MTNKKISIYGLLIALAFVLSYIESLIPVFVAVPGMKLGLTNVVVLYAVYRMDVKAALIINAVRIVLVGLTFATAISFCFSIAGGMISTAAMLLMAKRTSFSMVSTSIVGGIMHNCAQIIVAIIMLNTTAVAWYFVLLWFCGILTGAVIGIVGSIVVRHIGSIEI